MSEPTTGSAEPLQFDRAEGADASAPPADAANIECSSCHAPIKTYYYNVDDNAVCAKCRHVAEKATRSQRGAGAFVKALLVGGIAALLGAAIYYGVIAITNFEIGLVALLIGFMVGFGVRLGAGGAGGRRYQVLALILTYFAVGLAYTPLALKGAMDASKATADSLAVADTIAADDELDEVAEAEPELDSMTVAFAGDAASGDDSGAGPSTMGIGGAILGLAILAAGTFLMVFALPVFAVLGSLPSGLISALIIGFGMQQAWKMTAGHVPSITGPFRIGGAPPATDPSAEQAPAA